MSTITGLISAGGGGGNLTNIFTDPLKWPRCAVEFVQYRNGSTIYTSNATNFFTINGAKDVWYLVSVGTADTYFTCADITHSNGGYVHAILSTLADTSTNNNYVRITLDGTAYEFIYDNTSSTDSRMMFGSPFTYGTYGDNTFDFFTNAGNIDDPTNNVYGGVQYGYIVPPSVSHSRNAPILRFESSIKIEMKKEVLNLATAGYYAMALIELS